ncbi:LLM class flavin-dependent oxidoreductase [candidate division KSB1 bacterium]|nr:LLM class flavin-dependent oxidoreductase [candidate division KSB1 bacterium]
MYKEQIDEKQAPKLARALKYYVALRGNETPREYIRIGKLIEDLGFDRIYVYDDLMYRPSWPILTLLARHTKRIELGPCLVNGFYTHPAMIAENAVFLDEVSEGRTVLGLGRGAFFDFLNMDGSEIPTRIGCEETIQLVQRFLTRSSTPFKGQFFEATEKAVLRWEPPRADLPVIMGSWNEKMAFIGGKYCNELQVAEVWNVNFLNDLYQQLHAGRADSQATSKVTPTFSIGGMSCIALDEQQAYQRAKRTMAVYLPYLKAIMAKSGFDVNSEAVKQIEYFSKRGNYEQAATYIDEHMVKTLSLSGNPEQVVHKLEGLVDHVNIHGILFSPPYGTADTIDKNLELIVDQVIAKLQPGFKKTRPEVARPVTV